MNTAAIDPIKIAPQRSAADLGRVARLRSKRARLDAKRRGDPRRAAGLADPARPATGESVDELPSIPDCGPRRSPAHPVTGSNARRDADAAQQRRQRSNRERSRTTTSAWTDGTSDARAAPPHRRTTQVVGRRRPGPMNFTASTATQTRRRPRGATATRVRDQPERAPDRRRRMAARRPRPAGGSRKGAGTSPGSRPEYLRSPRPPAPVRRSTRVGRATARDKIDYGREPGPPPSRQERRARSQASRRTSDARRGSPRGRRRVPTAGGRRPHDRRSAQPTTITEYASDEHPEADQGHT